MAQRSFPRTATDTNLAPPLELPFQHQRDRPPCDYDYTHRRQQQFLPDDPRRGHHSLGPQLVYHIQHPSRPTLSHYTTQQQPEPHLRPHYRQQTRPAFMNPDLILDKPHFRYHSGETLLSIDYEPGEDSSVSSMDRSASTAYKQHQQHGQSSSSLGYSLDSQRTLQPRHSHNASQTLSNLTTPQGSPQTVRGVGTGGNSYHNGHGSSSFNYSSGSEGDLDPFSSRQPALLGDLTTTTATTTASSTPTHQQPLRRNSGIKMTAAKRLPPFNASRTSMPASAVAEGSTEGDDDSQRSVNRQQADRRADLEDDIVSISLDDDDDRDGGIRDRDSLVAREGGPNRTSESSRPKQSFVGVSSQASPFHPFPPPALRTAASAVSPSASFSTPIRVSQSQLNGAGTSAPRQAEPDRGPADLSNPSTALAEALRIARSKANSTSKAPQRSTSDTMQPNNIRGQDQSAGQRGKDGKLPAPSSAHSNGSLAVGQIRIPVPDLSPGLRGYASYHGEQQDMRRNPDGLLYPRRCSFTLSPTSSNPESRSDSHSGSLGTPRANINRDGTTSAKFSNASIRPGGPSISSKYSDDFGPHQQSQHHRHQSSYLETSYDSGQSGQNHDEDRYSRFAFPEQDHDQDSLSHPSYDDGPRHSSEYPQDPSGESFQQEYISRRRFPSSSESAPSNSYQNQRQPDQGASVRPKSSAGAGMAAYDQTHSSHSLGASEDLQDQMETEAEYIITRNTELLRILSIRDDEIKTLQQELNHSLKVIHEYEDELLKLHTTAAKPYESYHQTLDQIGHEMTQQDAIVKGYQEENEKLREQLKNSVDLRQEAEKRHLQAVDQLKSELNQLRTELDEADVQKYGTTDLRMLLQQAQESQDRTRKNHKDKEDEQLAEIADLKEQLKFTEKVLEEERKAKVKEMQKLERDIQDFRLGCKGMLAQIQSIDSLDFTNHSKGGSSSSSAEADITLGRDSDAHTASKGSTNAITSPTPPLSDSQQQQQQKDSRPKTLDRKPTSTETLTTANNTDVDKPNLEERLSKFEADIRQSLMRTASVEGFHSVRSSNGSGIPMATLIKPVEHLQSGHMRPELRLTGSGDETHLASALRERITSLNIENRRLQVELSSLGQVLRLQQAERQRKVAQLEELLDMHEAMANQKLEDSDTEEGQGRIRKVIQGLLVRIRTKEAEAEFYHNAYLDKVVEFDQMNLANHKAAALGGLGSSNVDAEETNISQATVEGLAVGSPSTTSPTTSNGASGIVEVLEARVKELERINLETSFRLAAEQRRVVASEAENATLVREKLTLARMLEDQVEQLQTKLSAAEIAKARLEDENGALRQKGTKDQQDHHQQQQQQQQQQKQSTQKDGVNAESMAIMRTRMMSLTRQRDQLREQLQEAFDIQLAMRDRTAGGVPEWTVDDYKRLERSLEEKSGELGVWKDRAIALERVVERIRMLKDKQEPIMGVSMDRRSSTQDSESMSSFSASGGQNERRRASHHTLEELDQVVLRLEQRLERRDQELQEVVLEAKRQTDQRLEAWKAKWVQVVQRKNAEIHRFQVELESLMAAVSRDRARMAASMQQK
ncbi:hypothetical protein BGZ96_009912 [Linnemannia gamsii]|uniref:Up-regulated during septation protein 1 domain-containing protein n=1 Tax=Linnemannia gamsii TaxID=64522 RepID=A0ABQ7KCZ3_9FUNG|nr:hypothetical protein BGZ96_009912 [Linnemannia gamsii]